MTQGRPAILTHLRGFVPRVRSLKSLGPLPPIRTLVSMNEAELHWLMAPDAPKVPLMLEDFLRRPDTGTGWRLAVASGRQRTPVDRRPTTRPCGRCVRAVRSVRSALRRRWPMTRWLGSGAGPRMPSGGRSAGGEWRSARVCAATQPKT